MPYSVPELNTKGVDVTNTLLAIKQGKDQAKYRNAILDMQRENQQKEQMKNLFSHAREGLAWVEANVSQGNPQAYANYREHMVKNMGMPEEALPSFEAFVDNSTDQAGQPTQTFNQERFTKWANRAMMQADDVVKSNFGSTKDYTQKIAYGPGGKTMMISVKKDENFDPEQEIGPGWSLATPDKPKHQEGDIRGYEAGTDKVTEEYRGGKWVKKASSPKWKAGEGGEYTPKQAIDKQSQILGAIARLNKGNAVDAIIATLDPSVSGLVGNSDPDSINAAKTALQNQLSYVQQYVPEKLRVNASGKTAGASSGSGKSYGDLWSMVKATGSSSAGLQKLKSMGYSDEQAREIIRKGIKAGEIR